MNWVYLQAHPQQTVKYPNYHDDILKEEVTIVGLKVVLQPKHFRFKSLLVSGKLFNLTHLSKCFILFNFFCVFFLASFLFLFDTLCHLSLFLKLRLCFFVLIFAVFLFHSWFVEHKFSTFTRTRLRSMSN